VKRGPRPADVRFYFDADVLGLAKVVAALRSDCTFPGDPGTVVHKRERPPCPITDPKTFDTVWIPAVAQRGWLIVTRDSRIQERRAEIAAVRDNGAKLLALASSDAKGTWAQLEVLLTLWRSIDALADQAGPFIYSASRTSLRPIAIAPA